ncbi:MAG: XRE family transcriptional regulator [Planctomycetota bacterium]|nr:MAG: XRE family transcriptional regulator [Planctomycetota bacterium]REJ97823.1 MAG: XRE family transcriptional regulator [Planctomycetota bacterium]REK25308.1 MAG: XRE family transcriptional regulator [Planctomycetota bacterium]REK31813.1 MAG: XRE family transcriptional regulator [Planctomycetota bacterium]
MEKSLFTAEYVVLLGLLRESRQHAGLTQVQLAERLGQSQSFVSKIERGETRLDLIQLRTICHSIGTTLQEFVVALEARLSSQPSSRRRKH